MVRAVLLDAGPLGIAASPRRADQFEAWLTRLRVDDVIVVPEIADFEVRRELVRLGATASLRRLDDLCSSYDYEPITTGIMRRAAELWAESRNRGRPLADPHALDADVILAATAEAVAARGRETMVATTNVGHLASLINAALWHEVR